MLDGSLCVQECFRYCYRVRDSFLREALREAPPPKSIMARVTVRINMIRSIEWVKKTIQVLIKRKVAGKTAYGTAGLK